MVLTSQQESGAPIAIPYVELPVINFYWNIDTLYVQMNIRSLVSFNSGLVGYHTGFIFSIRVQGINLPQFYPENDSEANLAVLLKVKIPENKLPSISLVGDFPALFHPHFKSPSLFGKLTKVSGEWVDYKDREDSDFEKDLGSYILRVARSVQYEKGYIRSNARQPGNVEALRFYRENSNPNSGSMSDIYFPTDDTILPSRKNFSISADPAIFHQVPTAINSNADHSISSTPQLQSSRIKPRFEIVESDESKPKYSPIEKEKENLVCIPDLNSISVRNNFIGREFYFTKSAFETIEHHIGWGRVTSDNTVEQCGILIGNAFHDATTGIVYGIAERAIPGKLARGTSSYLEVTHETWKEMLDYVDHLNTGLQVIGWYHTHPNNLSVFMSSTDQATQERLFGNNWQFAIVLNPHKRDWRAFSGASSQECKGFVLSGI